MKEEISRNQTEERSSGESELLSTSRIITLTDGIFSIAMTLLVLSIEVPDQTKITAGPELRQYLLNLYPQFFNYFLSFYLLSRIWVILHIGYHEIRNTNATHIWINIVLLMFVCLVPFSTSLDAEYSSDALAAGIFHCNMLAIALLCYWNWAYASKNHRLIRKDLPAADVLLAKRKLSIFPMAAIVALLCCAVSPSNSAFMYLLIPVVIHFLFQRSKQNSMDKKSVSQF